MDWSFANRIRTVAFLVVLSGVVAPEAHAYLDPGTGSYVFQMFLAALLSVGFVVKSYWSRIKSALSRSAASSKPESRHDEKT